ncbi:EAL domain-containing protein [Thermomonas sp.]|uniref:bifunctional diguanylate cyclase/phosphodiesterase n=1 Tax=Thermomonas sp. TaxID=1971895 RepID=UPI0024885B9F|nr:EAL domain-containing protein [Thermomonas sp.]MDI1251670.1 EAL domain-containing protein [Thermomonas sp.]
MNPVKPNSLLDHSEEIHALIETLHATEQRLEELTAGEVDTVSNLAGRTVMLQHAQEQLRQNEAVKQAAILNALPAHIALLDAQGGIVSVNETWRRFGSANDLLSPKFGVGLNYVEICDNADGDNAAEAQEAAFGLRAVLAGASNHFSLEYPCHSPNEQRWFQLTVTPVADGMSLGAVVMHLDITEKHHAEKRLRDLDQKYRTVFKASSDAIMILDENGFSEINDATLQMFGCKANGELLGKHPSEVSPPTQPGGEDSVELASRHMAKVFRGGSLQFEWMFRRMNGIDFLTDVLLTAMELDGKQVVQGTVRDITRRKATEEELTYKSTMLQTQIESSLDAILVVDETLRIISYNRNYVSLWQLPESLVATGNHELILQTILDQIEDPVAFAARVHYLYDHRDEKSREEVHLKDGRLIDRYSAPVTGADGKYYGRVWYFRDITESAKSAADLLESRQMLQLVLDTIPSRVFWKDTELNFLGCNKSFAIDAGFRSAEELVGRNDLEMLSLDRAKSYRSNDQLVLDGGKAILGIEESQPTSDGKIGWIRTDKVPMTNAKGVITGILGTYEDITERKVTEERIKYLNRVFVVQTGINSLLLRVQNRNELFREACNIAVDSGGFKMAMLGILDQDTMRIIPVAAAGKDEELLSSIRNVLNSDELAANTMFTRVLREKKTIVSNDSANDTQLIFQKNYAEAGIRSMAILPLLASGKAIGALALYASEIEFFHDQEMALLTQLTDDIVFAMDHIGQQEKLNYLAYYDSLTGLANRSLFFERVTQYLRSAESGGYKLAIGLIDLERFKSINDSLGRSMGDVLLKQVAAWMTQRAGDASLLAHINADHFAVVLPEVSSDGDLAKLMGHLRDSFQGHSFRLNEIAYRIGFKAGVAVFPDDGTDVDTLFKNAEAALKLAKTGGDRYLFYTQEMTLAVAEKLALENELRRAIDNEEFVLHYQPKVDLATGMVTSAEALIRWNHPRTGLVPPGKFIPILEQTGLIHEVGQWALRQAIADYLRWRRAGLLGLRIAVNVSPLQLRNQEFIAEVAQVIGIEPGASAGLELEITENLIMEDVGQNIAILKTLRAMGITVAIDDFGTGYSSLSHLARLPVDTLKIDRCFVTDMAISSEGLALVSTIITLAHSMKLKVVAEGVETEEQKRLLQLLGCDEMQGFLFSKAVPADEFEARFLMQRTH